MECKLCSRKFSNGKALGGHMRSHFATLPLPPKTPQRQELTDSLTDSTSSIFSSDDRESSAEKPKKRVDLVDRESESESTRVRCKRPKGEVTPISGDSLVEEDVALCLIMLSKDAWRGSDELTRFGMSRAVTKVHKCDECDRIFKSSQGLGSHRSNHHKNKINDDNEFGKPELALVTHECVICGRIFKSAQALGGHKRSHLLAAKFGVDDHAAAAIDLNLPAEIDDSEKIDTSFC